MAAISFAGFEFQLVDKTALFWPNHNALIVADLHLEKASWFAKSGQMLPPHDSIATLQRLEKLAASTGARSIWCLGDNFHDDQGIDRMVGDAVPLLQNMTRRLNWVWITGNHDEIMPAQVGGTICDELIVDGIVLRHRADPLERKPEFSGHFHPKITVSSRGRRVTRRCFVASDTKLLFPAFGSFTGGLAAQHPEIQAAIGAPATAIIQSGNRALRFAI